MVITDSKTHYGAEVGSVWSASTHADDHLSIKDCLKLSAAVSLPKFSCLMVSVPVQGGECCSPDLSFESHLREA